MNKLWADLDGKRKAVEAAAMVRAGGGRAARRAAAWRTGGAPGPAWGTLLRGQASSPARPPPCSIPPTPMPHPAWIQPTNQPPQEIEKLKSRAANGDHDAAGKMPYAERELGEKQAAMQGARGGGALAGLGGRQPEQGGRRRRLAREAPAAAGLPWTRRRGCLANQRAPASPRRTRLLPPRPAASQQAHDAEEAQQYERLRAALAQAPNLRSHVAAALDSVAVAMQSAKATITGPIGATAPTMGGMVASAPAMPAGKPAPAVPLSVPGMAPEQ